MIIRLDAGHDTNGNPRRVFVKLDRFGAIIGTWDEQYLGPKAIPERIRRQYLGTTFKTTPAEYRNLLKS